MPLRGSRSSGWVSAGNLVSRQREQLRLTDVTREWRIPTFKLGFPVWLETGADQFELVSAPGPSANWDVWML